MGYENVRLWFAKDESENIITIDEVKDLHNTYSCPICDSALLPKAIQSKKVTPHFAHVDVSKCGGEHFIHWWYKNKLIEPGDEFKVAADKERKYICKEVLIEKSFTTSFGEYRPDVTVITETGEIIYFEMAFSNKKKIQDYLDLWLELNNTVVEVDVMMSLRLNSMPTFKALFYSGKCFNVKKNDIYFNTIGKYKELAFHDHLDEDNKIDIKKLDYLWNDIARYKNGEIKLDQIIDLIRAISSHEKRLALEILDKQNCTHVLTDILEYEKHIFKINFSKYVKEIVKEYKGLLQIWHLTDDTKIKYTTYFKKSSSKQYYKIGYDRVHLLNAPIPKNTFDINIYKKLLNKIKREINKTIDTELDSICNKEINYKITKLNTLDKKEKTDTVKEVEKLIKKLNRKYSLDDDSYKWWFNLKNKACEDEIYEYYRCSVEFSSLFYKLNTFYIMPDKILHFHEDGWVEEYNEKPMTIDKIKTFLEKKLIDEIEYEAKIKNEISEIVNLNIKLIDKKGSLLKTNKIRYIKNLKSTNTKDISDILIPELKQLKSQSKIIIMVNKRHIDKQILSRELKYMGFNHVTAN